MVSGSTDGELSVAGDEMTGTVSAGTVAGNQAGGNRIVLRRVAPGSSPPAQPAKQ